MSKKIEDLLQQILEKLEEIRQNTAPAVPTVWMYPPEDGTDDSWKFITPCTAQQNTAGKAGCNCANCRPRAGGCAKCGCMNVAVFTEDGNWWCYECHSKVFDSEGKVR